MEGLIKDTRYAARMLLKQPGFTAAAVVALALGIGANSAIFSVVSGVLLRSLPFKNPDQLVLILSSKREGLKGASSSSYPDFADWRQQSQSLDGLAAFRSMGYALTGDGEPERVPGARVSGNFFSVLETEAANGRTFLPEEDQPGAQRVCILGHGLWSRRFSSDPGVVGRALTLNGQTYTVIGVLPRGFKFPIQIEDAELWTTVVHDGEILDQRGAHFLKVLGRLKPGVRLQSAQSEMDTITARLEQKYPADDTDRMARLMPIYDNLVGSIRPALYILSGAVAFVLLIACSNVANLLLARAASRRKEIAIRMALGAKRSRIIRQLLTESLLLAMVGGGAGTLLAVWGVEALSALSAGDIPRIEGVKVDASVLGFTLGVSLLTGLIFGLAPAIKSSSLNLNSTLKEGGRSQDTAGQHSLGNSLVVCQVSLALVLLIGAGLLIRSFLQLQQVNPGFDPAQVLTMQVSLPPSRYSQPNQVSGFFEQLIERIEALPGVQSAGGVTQTPLSGSNIRSSFTIVNQPAPEPGHEPAANLRAITPDYFRTMGVPLLRGRPFAKTDVFDATGVVIINEIMAKQFFPDRDPIGQQLELGVSLDDKEQTKREIIGVVGNVRQFTLEDEPLPEMYVPHTQQPWPGLTLAIRTTGDPMALSSAARDQLRALDPDQPVWNMRPMSQLVTASIARPRFYMTLLGTFAALALSLAAVGIYGVLSYSVTQRTHEVGLRMALGAQPRNVLMLIVKQGVKMTAIGLVFGLAGAFALTRLMSSLLFGVSANDGLTFLLLSLLLVIVALAACYIPARRATKVEPMSALRCE
jgi:putative ABC transport system permease protein